MRLIPISGYTDCNGRRVPPYVQRRRAAAPRLGQQDALRAAQVIDDRRSGWGAGGSVVKGATKLAATAAGVLVAGWALWQAVGQVREFTGDRLENPAPLAGSSWFATAGVVCEATGGWRPSVRCQLADGLRRQAVSANPLCESKWYGAIVALRAGEGPQSVCADGPLGAPLSMEVLDAGQTATYGSLGAAMLTCRSLRDGGMYCYDQGGGRGFEFGPTGYRFDDAFLGQVTHRDGVRQHN